MTIDLLSHEDYRHLATTLRLPTTAYINGKFVPAESGETFASVNPANGEKLADIAACDKADVDKAVKVARHVFAGGEWAKASPDDRKAVLIKWAKLLTRHAQEIATLEALDSGKPINDCINVDMPETIDTIKWYAEAIDKIFDHVAPTGDDVLSLIVREPIGVVGAVLPWNFPLLMAAWKMAPALATGCSVILKPAQETSMSILRVAELASEAGLPKGVLQVITGGGETAGKAIGEHSDIDMVSFTGSTVVGRLFLKYAADSNLKKVVLELGGKNPFVVLDDATQLEEIAEHAVNATFWNMGENCSSGSRVIIHRSLYQQLTDLIVEKTKRLSTGQPLDPKNHFGALVSEQHYNKVRSFIDKGIASGYELLAGGLDLPEGCDANGYFVQPTIFGGVANDSDLGQQEIFGPVMSIIVADSNEQAIALANDTDYGLAASLFCRDVYSVHQYAKQIRAGTVTVNCFGEGNITTPFGGYKQSGFGGRDNGLEAFEQYTETKTIWIDLHS